MRGKSQGESLSKKPTKEDVLIGTRIRERRMIAGLAQHRLAQLLGISFQQLQKYEKGTNRVSAARLYEISQILGVDFGFFVRDIAAQHEGKVHNALFGLIEVPESLELLQLFQSIADKNVRAKLLALAKALAASDSD